MEKDRRDTTGKGKNKKAAAQETKSQAGNIPAVETRAGDKPGLCLTRHFKAPPELVYQAWTDPKKLVHWFGPDAGPVVSAATDVAVGGRFHIVFQTMDGEEHDVSGLYREVVPNRKLVFTWMWRTMPERQSLVTVSLQPDGKGTSFTLLHEQFFDEAARDGHRRGWSGALDKLARFLAA